MTKYIDAEEFKNGVMAAMTEESAKDGSLPLQIGLMLCHFMDDTPSADVQEVRHGKWVKNKHVKRIYYCSECGRHIEDGAEYKNVSEHFPYCHCGARMDRERKGGVENAP